MIYWLKAGDTGAVKVGYAARDVAARVRLLQTGCPWPLVLLRTEAGERDLEAALHRHYREKHLRAEWFALSDEDVSVDLSSIAFRPWIERSPFEKKLHSDPALAAIRLQRGLLSSISRGIGVTHASVVMWKRVPSKRVPAVSRITGIPRHVLRPDLWDNPAGSSDQQPATPADAAA